MPVPRQPDPRRIARSLVRWFRSEARELPWRETRDPYRIWVSEVMLQQTRVETVLAYYEPFVTRFPDVRALADAELESVLEAWSGLGYYRRARFLHAGARHVVEHMEAQLPSTVDGLREVPGIGPYTAGALASIAFDRPEPLVDGNVARVSTRLRAVREPSKQGASARAHWEFVREVLEAGTPRVLAQALMELGALVCKPRSPDCERCPVAKECRARALGLEGELPAPKKKKKSPELHFDALALRWGRRVLLERRADEGLLAGMWCLPLRARKEAEPSGPEALPEPVADLVASEEALAGRPIRHVFTHRIWILHPRSLRLRRRPRRPTGAQWAWIEPGERPPGGVPSVTNKLLERLGY